MNVMAQEVFVRKIVFGIGVGVTPFIINVIRKLFLGKIYFKL